MYQLIDFLNPQKDFGITEGLAKIHYNVNQIEPLKNNINQLKKANKDNITSMTGLGRWIIIYQSNLKNDNQTKMFFIDFRLNTDIFIRKNIFSDNTIKAINKIQKNYENLFSEKIDKVELSFSEPYEKILKPNLFLCNDDNLVLTTAERLGLLLFIEKLNEKEKVKVAIGDELIIKDGLSITNVYAIIHFGGHRNIEENGIIYIKIYDLLNNYFLVDEFQSIIEKAGGKFNKTLFIQRFSKEQLN